MKKILLAILAFAIFSISLASCSVNSEANTQKQIQIISGTITDVEVQKITVGGTRCVLAISQRDAASVAISCNWFND